MRLAAASVVIAFGLEYGDLRKLEIWIRRHRDAGGDTPIGPTERFEPTLLMAIVCAAFMEGKYPPEVDSASLIQRLRQLLELPDVWLSDDQRIQAGRQLIEHARIFRNQVTVANAIVATRRVIDGGMGGSLHKGRWFCAAARACIEEGDPSESLGYLQQAQALAEQSNSLALRYQSSFALADHWMKAQMLTEAEDGSPRASSGNLSPCRTRRVCADDSTSFLTSRPSFRGPSPRRGRNAISSSSWLLWCNLRPSK